MRAGSEVFFRPAAPGSPRFPVKERPYMPGSWTSPDRPRARANAPVRVAFRGGKRVGVRDYRTFAAQWLACTIPCRRFADTLAGAAARLGADVVRYSFIAVDSHHLLLASLPAHSHGSCCSRFEGGLASIALFATLGTVIIWHVSRRSA